MIGLNTTILTSERLTYRLLTENDKASLKLLLSDRDVTAPAGFLPCRTDAEFHDFFSALTQHNTAVAVMLGDELIGYFHVNKYVADGLFAHKRCVGVGFVIGKAYQGRGFGKEMVKRMSEHLLERFDACFGDVFSGNEASRRTLESCFYRYLEDYTMFFEELGEEKLCHSYVLTK